MESRGHRALVKGATAGGGAALIQHAHQHPGAGARRLQGTGASEQGKAALAWGPRSWGHLLGGQGSGGAPTAPPPRGWRERRAEPSPRSPRGWAAQVGGTGSPGGASRTGAGRGRDREASVPRFPPSPLPPESGREDEGTHDAQQGGSAAGLPPEALPVSSPLCGIVAPRSPEFTRLWEICTGDFSGAKSGRSGARGPRPPSREVGPRSSFPRPPKRRRVPCGRGPTEAILQPGSRPAARHGEPRKAVGAPEARRTPVSVTLPLPAPWPGGLCEAREPGPRPTARSMASPRAPTAPVLRQTRAQAQSARTAPADRRRRPLPPAVSQDMPGTGNSDHAKTAPAPQITL